MREVTPGIGRFLLGGGLIAGMLCPLSAHAAPARSARKTTAKPAVAAASITRIAIEPREATLTGQRSAQRFLVTATLKDGSLVDVTGKAAFKLSNPKIARVAPGGTASPLGDGETKVTATVGTLTTTAALLKVEEAQTPQPVSFVSDVVPILSKQGCNASICHGSPAGKGGLKLSLFGYEPELDHEVLKDKDGKRVNPKDPEKSLVLQKPTMGVAHAGGLRFKKGSTDYNTLLAWVKAGAPGMGELEARIRKIDALPAERLIATPKGTQRLVITATLSDGTTQDVTDKALFSSNDDAIAAVSDAGLVTARRTGETAIMVRHLGQVAVARIAVLPEKKLTSWPKLPTNNFIDQIVFDKLKKLHVLPADLSSDEEFLRRAYIDTIGMVPSVTEAREFLDDKDRAKRAKLIDRLLARPEFVDVWTLKWNDTLRNNPRLTRLGLATYHNWIREQVEKNVPMDQFVKSLLTATGQNDQVGQVNYFLVSRDPLDLTSATSQIFMGVRIECARCHNHPFEKWTQNDYYGLAAFFSRVRRVGNGNQAPATIMVAPPNFGGRRGQGQVRHPKTNQPVEPKPLDDVEIKLDSADYRVALADWMTSPKNPFFARSISNRIWAHFLGRGIVDPVDDFRVTNPPANPALLDALARELVDKKYDVKQLMRVIMNSRVYQLSSKANPTNRTDTRNFARAYPKRMSAEQMYDSISQACDAFTPLVEPRERRGQGAIAGGNLAQIARQAMDPAATRAHQIPVPRIPGEIGTFLDAFGRPRREVVCECERSVDGSVTQALVLINSDLINRKIEFPRGRVQQLLGSTKPDREIIEEMYLATLSRRPTAAEVSDAQSLLKSGQTRQQGLEDLMWGLLNTREFLFNH